MKTAAALIAALALSVTAACSSGSPSGTAAPQLTRHTTCAEWSNWDGYYRVLSAGDMADAMGAYDTSANFHQQFARNLLTACQGDEQLSVMQVAAGLATIDTRDFS